MTVLEAVKTAGTAGPNFRVSNRRLCDWLSELETKCRFGVGEATETSLELRFRTLPEDLDSLVRDIQKFCPDTVEQHYAVLPEMIELADETGHEISPEVRWLVEEVDLSSPDFALEIFKKALAQTRRVVLWWD